jgi:hypothetical protein
MNQIHFPNILSSAFSDSHSDSNPLRICDAIGNWGVGRQRSLAYNQGETGPLITALLQKISIKTSLFTFVESPQLQFLPAVAS